MRNAMQYRVYKFLFIKHLNAPPPPQFKRLSELCECDCVFLMHIEYTNVNVPDAAWR
jgi:hypothetical protein